MLTENAEFYKRRIDICITNLCKLEVVLLLLDINYTQSDLL